MSLIIFVEGEVKNLANKTAKEKKLKLIKFMLKSLTKEEIINGYCPHDERVAYSKLSKNEVIDRIVKSKK